VDVGTLNGYREAMRVLGEQNDETIYIPLGNRFTGKSFLQ
jgi:hypothetical protein